MTSLRRIYPALARLRPYLRRSNRLATGAARSWLLAPAQEAKVPPAIFEAGDLQRITGVTEDDTIAGQIRLAQGGAVSHGATVAYELRDAVIAGGHVFAREVYYPLGSAKVPMLARADAPHLAEAVLATTPYGVRYFGHWMGDDLPLQLAARDLGTPLSVLANPSPQQQAYLRLLGLTGEVFRDAAVDRLVVLDDTGQNSYKQARIRSLHGLAQPCGGGDPVPGVMLLRGEAGANKHLVNESQIADVARRRGFTVLDPTRTDAEQLVRICNGAKIVLGVEGSQLMNGLLWMDAGGTLVTLQPPQRFCMVLKDWCDAIGTGYAFIVGQASGGNSFRVDPDALQRLLDGLPS
jgi:hypothetical protein